METIKEYVLRRYTERGDVYSDPVIDEYFFTLAEEYVNNVIKELVGEETI